MTLLEASGLAAKDNAIPISGQVNDFRNNVISRELSSCISAYFLSESISIFRIEMLYSRGLHMAARGPDPARQELCCGPRRS